MFGSAEGAGAQRVPPGAGGLPLAFCLLTLREVLCVWVGKVGRTEPRGRGGRAAVLRELTPSVYQLVLEAVTQGRSIQGAALPARAAGRAARASRLSSTLVFAIETFEGLLIQLDKSGAHCAALSRTCHGINPNASAWSNHGKLLIRQMGSKGRSDTVQLSESVRECAGGIRAAGTEMMREARTIKNRDFRLILPTAEVLAGASPVAEVRPEP